MVYKRLTNKDIKEMCDWLKFYDNHKFFPFDKKKIAVSISGDNYVRLKNVKNKSALIDNVLKKSTIRTTF